MDRKHRGRKADLVKTTRAGRSSYVYLYEAAGLIAQGGHFAALEVPEDFWEDIEEFIKAIN